MRSYNSLAFAAPQRSLEGNWSERKNLQGQQENNATVGSAIRANQDTEVEERRMDALWRRVQDRVMSMRERREHTRSEGEQRDRRKMEARIEVRSCVPHVMNHAFSSPRNELERTVAMRPVREINNVICSLGSRPIRSGPKDFSLCRDRDGGRTSGGSCAFVTAGRKPPQQLSSFLERFCHAFHLVPVPLARCSRTLTARNCQRQWKLSRPLMVFERGQSDAKDERTHAGQITILPSPRQTRIFSSPSFLSLSSSPPSLSR